MGKVTALFYCKNLPLLQYIPKTNQIPFLLPELWLLVHLPIIRK